MPRWFARLGAVHYNGRVATIRTTEEYDAWFAGLRDRTAQLRIAMRIRRLSAGNPGDHRNLKKGVTEMRIDCGPGYRVYYVTRADVVFILLCGGDKSTQQADIDRAQAMADHV